MELPSSAGREGIIRWLQEVWPGQCLSHLELKALTDFTLHLCEFD